MVLAAGLGKRMRPLTASRPKPLIEVAGKTAARSYSGEAAARGGRTRSWSTSIISPTRSRRIWPSPHGLDISFRRAALLLETGGGMVKAAPLDRLRPVPGRQQRQSVARRAGRHAQAARVAWDDEPGWTRCCFWCPTRAPLTIGPSATFHMDRSGPASPPRAKPRRAVRLHRHTDRLEAAAGRRSGGPFSTNLPVGPAIEEGRCFGAVHQGLWFDVGTPQSIKATELILEDA
jgi:N-acetyl-alpha-D-muramate 1-phosphate uridylyltransferase